MRRLVFPWVIAAAFMANACGGTDIELSPEGLSSQEIVSGQLANASQVFGTVYLQISGGNCTGTLISPTVVVTAAHCVAPQPGWVIPASQIQVGAGALDVTYAQASQIYSVSAVTPHPQYTYLAPGYTNDPTGLGNMNDIAVLVLSTPVQGLQPVPILSSNELDAQMVPGSTQLLISGYGLLQAGGYPNTSLYIAATPYQRRSESEILTGGIGAPDTCQGDSGGPAYLVVGSQPYLVGATSRGIANTNIECGAGGVSTLVPAFVNWIASVSYGGYTAPGGPGVVTPPPTPETCANECAQGVYAACSCGVEDPCGWKNDNTCDSQCTQFTTTPFDDSRDCGTTPPPDDPPPPTDPVTACNGACQTASYNSCTCGTSDPCGWSGDGFCDASCTQYRATPFDDSQDCGTTTPDPGNPDPPDNPDPPPPDNPPSNPDPEPPVTPPEPGDPSSPPGTPIQKPEASPSGANDREVVGSGFACRCLSVEGTPPVVGLFALLPWLVGRRRRPSSVRQ